MSYLGFPIGRSLSLGCRSGSRRAVAVWLAFGVLFAAHPAFAAEEVEPLAAYAPPVKRFDRALAVGITLAKGYGLVGVVGRIRPSPHLVLELGGGIRPWIVDVSGCGEPVEGSGVEWMSRASLGVDFLKFEGRHHLGIEVGGGFAQNSGPQVDGGPYYEIFLTRWLSLQTVLGVAYWPLEREYNRRFFRREFHRDFDQLMACAKDGAMNTYEQNWGIHWGLGVNFYFL